MRITALSMVALLALGTAACEPGETGDEDMAADTAADTARMDGAEAGAAGETPAWFQVDHDARTVTMTVVGGATDDANYWNFNGMHGGQGSITVPEGYEVTIEFRNDDPNTPHSLGITDQAGSELPANMTNIDPVWEGAITSGAATMAESTQPGESETITFTAEEAGEYTMACWVPGHAAVGMWVEFNVESGETAEVEGAPDVNISGT